MPLAKGLTFGIGMGIVTGWLRTSVDAYVALCNQNGVTPAAGIDGGGDGEGRIAAKWKAVALRS